MSVEVQDRPAIRAEVDVDNDLPPMVHIFPGYEYRAVPVGAIARCGYRNRGLVERIGGPVTRDCCVVCEAGA